jgi:hypothetical protein
MQAFSMKTPIIIFFFVKSKDQNIPRMTAKIDDKRPNVNANGAATIIA